MVPDWRPAVLTFPMEQEWEPDADFIQDFSGGGTGDGMGIASAVQTAAAQEKQGAAAMAAEASSVPAADNPVADPKAVVIFGNARFTVLTPQLIRMEWAADGKFEDHASFVFHQSPAARAEFDGSTTSGPAESAASADDQDRRADADLHARRATATSPPTISPSRSPSMASR